MTIPPVDPPPAGSPPAEAPPTGAPRPGVAARGFAAWRGAIQASRPLACWTSRRMRSWPDTGPIRFAGPPDDGDAWLDGLSAAQLRCHLRDRGGEAS